mgnify:CR=1 FL=1
MNYLNKSVLELHELLKEKKIKPIDLVEEAFENIEANKELNAYITLNKEEALTVEFSDTYTFYWKDYYANTHDEDFYKKDGDEYTAVTVKVFLPIEQVKVLVIAPSEKA